MSQINRREYKPMLLSRFQKWFIGSSLAYLFVILSLLNLGIYLWYRLTVSELLRVSGLLSPTLLLNMKQSVRSGVGVLVVVNLVIVVISAIHSVYFSRKIAGPIYALTKHLRRVTEEGRFSALKLRKGDLFEDLPEQLDKAFGSVCSQQNQQLDDKLTKVS
jgi:methyl-accepting chemotaxis protein